MQLNYTLTEEDFLTYHLYSDTNSKFTQKRKRILTYLIPVIYLIVGGCYFYGKEWIIGGVLLGFSVIWIIFYPLVYKYIRKRAFKKYVKEQYKNRINRITTLTFDTDGLHSQSDTIESTVGSIEFEELTELKTLFLLKLKTGVSFIIRKDAIENVSFFKDKIKEYEIPYVEALTWKW